MEIESTKIFISLFLSNIAVLAAFFSARYLISSFKNIHTQPEQSSWENLRDRTKGKLATLFVCLPVFSLILSIYNPRDGFSNQLFVLSLSAGFATVAALLVCWFFHSKKTSLWATLLFYGCAFMVVVWMVPKKPF